VDTATELPIEPLVRWLAGAGVELGGGCSITRLAGGRSNPTYRLRGELGDVVVRRPPTGPILATAHDVVREARLMAAVGRAGVPVPAVLATCADVDVIGAPFFVMAAVDGVVLRDADTAAGAGPALRARAGFDLVDALLTLHDADVAALGLGDLQRPGNYVDRQLRRWSKQWAATWHEELPVMDEVWRRLTETLPRQQRVALVHGDPKLDNCIMRQDIGLVALVDWELATVGDPLADLALLLAYWAEPADARYALQAPPTAVPGFATRTELIDRYAGASPIDLEALPYYMAFSYWKLACIVAGVHERLSRGALGRDRDDVAAYACQVVRLAELAYESTVSGSAP
jgi:aminoglycoside phosphotransferase (APT) family kinase protein